MGTGPDRIHLMWESAILLCDRDAHRKVKPFLLVRFLCGLPKKMEAVAGGCLVIRADAKMWMIEISV